jgi:thioredoxin-like negative regulator of GroEL
MKSCLLAEFYDESNEQCQSMKQKVENIASRLLRHPKSAVTIINVQKTPDIQTECGVRCVPTVVLYVNGQVAERITTDAAYDIEALDSAVSKALEVCEYIQY